MISKLRLYVRTHKIISIIVAVVVVGGGYYWYASTDTATAVTKYEVEAATEGSVIASVSGTGQAQAGSTIDVDAKVSEDVTSIPATIGEHVTAGQLLVQLDPTNEQQAVNSAQLSLQSAQLALAQLTQIATTTLLQQQDSVQQGQTSLVTASTTLAQDYQNGFNNLGTTFVNLQTIMVGLQDFVTGNDLSRTQDDPDAYVNLMPDYLQAETIPYDTNLQASYAAAVSAYQQDLTDYHAASLDSNTQTMDSLFNETYNTANTISAAVKSGKDFLNFVINTYPSSSSTKPLPTITNTLQTNFGNYTATITSQVSGLQSTITGITNDRNAITNDQASLAEASATLAETMGGPTQTQQLSAQIAVENAQNNLTTAEDNLAYTSVRAPISGTVSAIGAIVGETPGSDAVTIVGDGEVVEVTLNEIDAAKVSVGDPATLTFDAISGLSLAGQVVEIDPVGTVSQGVVNYNAQIGFSQPADTSSTNLVKPGMSATASIVTQADQNVIAVPNAAVVTSGGSSYILEPATPLSTTDLAASTNGGIVLTGGTKMVPVTVGLTNATMSEITSGVSVGDQIIVQTIKSTTATKTTASTGGSALQLLGGTGAARTGGGGFVGGGGGFTRGGGG